MAVDVTALAIKVTSDGIKEASSAIGGLSVSAGNAEKRTMALEAAMKLLNITTLNSSTAMNAYGAKLAQQLALLQGLQTNTTGAAGATASLAAAMALLTASLNALNQNTLRAQQAQRGHNESMREAHALARGLSGSMGALWVTYGNFAGMAAGLALGFGFKAIISVGKDVENTLEGIRVRGVETVQSINDIRDSIMALGQGVYGPKEVAKAFDVLVLAGLDAKQALIAVKDALNLATVGGTTIEKAATVLVQVGTSLNYTAEGYSRIADVISMTAAASVASVESISESFKSGSAVGKLYGVTLVDIGTQFAALSNLGIKGSAAGTAVKNFYSNLASGSDKVTEGLNKIGLSIQDLQDKEGNFKSYSEVMKTLNGDLAKGFNSVSEATEKTVIAMTTNERGSKLMVESLSLVRKAGVETATALDDLNKKIDESWGMAAAGAAAMALTIDAQLKSVKNTLEVQFLKAFQDIQPQISVVATKLKEAFNTPEFLSAIQSAALALANLGVFLVENVGKLQNLFAALLAYKAAAFVAGLITGIAEGFLALKAALEVAKIASIAFQASLGLLGIALAASAAALVWWAAKRNEATNSAQSQASLNYMDDFTGKLDEETKRLRAQIALMKEGKTAREADTMAMQNQQIEMVKLNGEKAVAESVKEVVKLKGELTAGELRSLDRAHSLNASAIQGLGTVNAVLKAEREVEKTIQSVATKRNDATKALQEQRDASKELAIIADKQAADARLRNGGGTGTGANTSAPNKKAISDEFNAELKAIQGKIDAVRRELKYTEEDLQSKYKQGQMGELRLIYQIEAAEKQAAATTIDLLQKKLAVAKGGENKKAVSQEIENAKKAQGEVEIESSRTRANKEAEFYSKLEVDNLKSKADGLRSQGLLADAYMAENEGKYLLERKHLTDNIMFELDAVKEGELNKRVEYLDTAQAAGLAAAKNKESTISFTTLATEVSNSMKGVQTASEGMGLGAMFDAATAASKRYADAIGELRDRQGSITDSKDLAESETKMIMLAETQRKLWAGVGDSISKSLGDAFGSAGKAAGEMLTSAVTLGNTESKLAEDKKKALKEVYAIQGAGIDYAEMANKVNIDFSKKEASARVKAYSDMAGAAKGFFKEGTTGYKIMEGVQRAFQAWEIASNIATFVTKSGLLTAFTGLFVASKATETAATVASVAPDIAASMAKGAVAAAVGVAGQAQGDPYSAWARMAAMAAVMAALGFAVSGGGSGGGGLEDAQAAQKKRIETQGSGTVLGDTSAKSDSIKNSLALIAQYTFEELEYSNKMVNALEGLVASITGVSKSLILTSGLTSGSAFGTKEKAMATGLLSGLFGSSSNTITGSGINVSGNLASLASGGGKATGYETTHQEKSGALFGLFGGSSSDSTKTFALGQDFKDALQAAFSNVRSGLVAVGTSLGLGATDLTEQLNAIETNISVETRGLKGKELQDAVTAVFSAEMDRITGLALAIVKPFQQVGEGLLETAVRVANSSRVIDLQLQSVGMSFGAIGLSSLKARMSLVDMAGGLDKFVSKSNYFKDNFLTDEEKLAPVRKAVTDEMARLGESSITTIEAFKSLVLSQDLSTQAGQEMYSALLNVAPAFKKVTDVTDKAAEVAKKATDVADKRASLEIDLLEAQGRSVEVLAINRRNELAELYKLDPALVAIKQSIYDLTDATKAADAALVIAKERRGLEIEIMTLTGDTAGALAAKRAIELAAIDATNRPLQQRIYALQDEKTAADAAQAAITKAQADAKTSSDALAKAQQDAATQAKTLQDAQDKRVNDAKSNLQKAVSAAATALEGIISKLSGFSTSARTLQQSLLFGDLSTSNAAQKYADAKANLPDVIAKANLGDESSLSKLEQFVTLSKEASVSFEDYQRDFQSVVITLDNSATVAERQLQVAKDQLAALHTQTDAILGVDNTVMTVAQAIDALNAVTANGLSSVVLAIGGAQSAQANALKLASMPPVGGDGVNQSYRPTFDQVNKQIPLENAMSSVRSQIQSYFQSALGTTDTSAIYKANTASGVDSVNSPLAGLINSGLNGQLTTELLAQAQNSVNAALTGVGGKVASIDISGAFSSLIDGSHASGLESVPFDGYIAQLHKGERVQTAEEAKMSTKEGIQELIHEIKNLRAETRAVASNTKESFKIFDRWTQNGLPATEVA